MSNNVRYQERDRDYLTDWEILAKVSQNAAQTISELFTQKRWKHLMNSMQRLEIKAAELRTQNAKELQKDQTQSFALIDKNLKRIGVFQNLVNSLYDWNYQQASNTRIKM
jgi:hypothetical protein